MTQYSLDKSVAFGSTYPMDGDLSRRSMDISNVSATGGFKELVSMDAEAAPLFRMNSLTKYC